MRQCTYLYVVESCLPNSAVFKCLLNVSFSSTVLMPPGQIRASSNYFCYNSSFDFVIEYMFLSDKVNFISKGSFNVVFLCCPNYA